MMKSLGIHRERGNAYDFVFFEDHHLAVAIQIPTTAGPGNIAAEVMAYSAEEARKRLEEAIHAKK